MLKYLEFSDVYDRGISYNPFKKDLSNTIIEYQNNNRIDESLEEALQASSESSCGSKDKSAEDSLELGQKVKDFINPKGSANDRVFV